MKRFVLLFCACILVIGSCDKPLIGYKYNQGSLPTSPVNLTAFNTEYDDYNSSAPSLGDLIPFCFSTNRKSKGKDFDIIYKPMNINFDKSTGELKITSNYGGWNSKVEDFYILGAGLAKIGTSGNEYGPYLIPEYNGNKLHFTLLYSTDVSGKSKIYYISNSEVHQFSEPKEVEFLNSEYNDMYPSFNKDKSQMYFCSDRKGNNFDIYGIDFGASHKVDSILSSGTDSQALINSTLSSTADDKCPFILEDRMVFTSNRPGGYGGYDLYYSDLVDGKWTTPKNFGPSINTKDDEYRPILIHEGVSQSQTMMVFSSNRAGGHGGFDLYFVGIDD